MRSYLEIADELDQHLIQVQAVIDCLSVDICNNKGEFSVSGDCVSGMLWTAQTLLQNAIKTADKLHKAKLQETAFTPQAEIKIAQIEQQRLSQTGVKNDETH